MFILKLLRALLGYVVFESDGGFPERFLNLCAKAKLPLWDVQFHGTVLQGKTTVQGYKQMRKPAHYAGVHPHIAARKGLPFVLAQNKKRSGLWIGACICLLLMSFLSSMIWSVEVSGNQTVPTEEILQAADELGIRVGVRKNSLEAAELAEEIQSRVDGLSWVAVNLDFSKARIEVREITDKPEILDVQTPANVVAAEDGLLTRLDVYSGTPQALEGSGVVKGDLLISGVMGNADSSERLKGAEGHAYARVQRPFTFSAEAQAVCPCTVCKKDKTLLFFGLQLPLRRKADARTYRIERFLANSKTVLPIGIQERHYTAFAEQTQPATDALGASLAAMRFCAFYKTQYLESQILEEKVTFSLDKNSKKICGMLICEKDIGKKQEIFVEKN